MDVYIHIYIYTHFSLSLCAVNIILQHIVILFHPMNIAFLQYIYAHKQFLKNVYAFICLCATTHLHMFTHGYAYRICWPYVSASNKESMKNKHDMNKMTRITVDLYTVCIYIYVGACGGSLKWGVPPKSSIYRWIFHSKPTSYWGSPMTASAPDISIASRNSPWSAKTLHCWIVLTLKMRGYDMAHTIIIYNNHL